MAFELGFDPWRLGRQWDQHELSVRGREPKSVLGSRTGVNAGEKWEISMLLKCQASEFGLLRKPESVYLGKMSC